MIIMVTQVLQQILETVMWIGGALVLGCALGELASSAITWWFNRQERNREAKRGQQEGEQ
jgi:hypothetical protein